MAQQRRPQQQRDMNKNMMEERGRAHTKVAGDDEMLRTGFHNGTPLEAGKIAADSQPVDLFAPAHCLAEANNKESEAVDLNAGAREANSNDDNNSTGGPYYDPSPVQGRQGIAEPAVGGRRLGRQ